VAACQAVRTCAYCGHKNQLDATHCEECGTEITVSAPLPLLATGAANRFLILAACVVVVLLITAILSPWQAAKQNWLTLTFIGLTNYSGHSAAAFTVTNCGREMLSLSVTAETQAGWTRPIYPDPIPYEPKPPAGAARPGLIVYPTGGPYQLQAGRGLTFITAVPSAGTRWHVTVHYVAAPTRWQTRRLMCAQFFWRRSEFGWLGDLIWRRGTPYFQSGVVYSPDPGYAPK